MRLGMTQGNSTEVQVSKAKKCFITNIDLVFKTGT